MSAIVIPYAEGVKLVKNVLIPMRDGVRLAADLYMPDSAEPGVRYPVVMEYIPYRKDEIMPGNRFYEYLPRHGYVVARLDIRGTGGSEGVTADEYTPQEQVDGCDAIEWLAQQPWCDGHINMMGISYGGFTALQVAAHNPPHLTTIIPVDFTDDRYTDDCHYRGGLLRMYYDVGWYGGRMIAWNAMPPYPEWSGAEWAQVWEQHLAHNEPYLLKWLNHQTDGPYWRQGSVRDITEKIKCPVFMIGGWRDGYPNPPLRLFQALKVPRKVLIGPWNHAYPDSGIPGPRIDHLYEVVRWLDHWCKGASGNGIMDEPPITVYVQHSQKPIVDRLDSAGEWRSEIDWPPPGASERVLYLCERSALGPRPGEVGADAFDYHPTVGVTRGLWSGGLQFGLPGDQRADEAFSLVYTTPPLEEEVYLLGWPRVVLHAASSASVMGFAVSLCDVAPDGASHLITAGMLNATRRESLSQPQALTPGEVYELEIEIDCTAWKFAKGHRIRLSIASADFPNVWPTPELGANHVFRGAARPSRLILPTVPPQGSAQPPEFRPSPKSLNRHSAAPQAPTWRVEQDVLTGRTTVEICFNTQFRLNATTVIQREFGSLSQVDPNDPAQASVRGWHVCRIVRSALNHTIQGRTDVLIQSTASHFHTTIDLDVRVNDAPHFSRRWVESIPRQLL
jgi:putative CocE/NonD family hydrolase